MSIEGSAKGAAILTDPGDLLREEPLRTAVRAAFADSLRVVWQVCIGISGFAFVLSLFVKSLPLATVTDEEHWGLREKAVTQELATPAPVATV